jgi:plastocyanin
MNKRFGAIAIVVVAAAGLFAGKSSSAPTLSSVIRSTGVCYKGPVCSVSLTSSAPSPSRVTMPTGDNVFFENTDSVTHTVVFANGHCNLTIPPGIQGAECRPNFLAFVGSYAYKVDNKFSGTVVTIPWRRSVTLTARRHAIRRGTRLTLHGRVRWNFQNPAMSIPEPFHVIVLARHNSSRPFEPIATIPVRVPQGNTIGEGIRHGWKLNLQPGVTTTYIAKVTGGTPPHWQGQFWASARSRPFTVRIRH